jgi:hypothetical protein
MRLWKADLRACAPFGRYGVVSPKRSGGGKVGLDESNGYESNRRDACDG